MAINHAGPCQHIYVVSSNCAFAMMAGKSWLFLILLIQYVWSAHNPIPLAFCQSGDPELQVCKLNNNYVSSAPPKPHPVLVEPKIHIFDILNVDPEEQTFNMFFDLLLSWNDTSITISGQNSSSEWYDLTYNNDDFWKPKISIEKVRSISKVDAYGGGRTTFSFWLKHPHLLEYSEEMIVTVTCEFNFGAFPFDVNECKFKLGDPVYEVDKLVFGEIEVYVANLTTTIGQDPIVLDRNPFTISISALPTTTNEYPIQEEYYSWTGISIKFERSSMGLLLGRFYFPTSIFASLSLISFFIDYTQVPGRMGMLVTLYLCSVNVYASIDAPKNRGFSYIDLWMIGTQLPILLALLEFGSLLCIVKYDLLSYFDSKVAQQYQPNTIASSSSDKLKTDPVFSPRVTAQHSAERFKILARRTDMVFFFIGSSYFFLFALIYWCLLL